MSNDAAFRIGHYDFARVLAVLNAGVRLCKKDLAVSHGAPGDLIRRMKE